MLTLRVAPRAAGGLVVLLGLAVLLAGPWLVASLSTRLESSARDLQVSLEARTGFKVSFGRLSPSVLKGLSLGKLEVRDSRDRPVLSARKAYARYDLLSILWPARGSLIRELSITDASLVIDPGVLALLSALGKPRSGEEGGTAQALSIPPIALSGTRVSLRLEGFAPEPMTAELSSFSLGGPGPELALDLRGSLSTGAVPALGRVDLSLSASGTLERDLSRARLHLGLQAATDLLSLRPQSLELVYAQGILEARKIEDKAPIDAWLRYDKAARTLEARLKVEGFIPSTAIVPGRGLIALLPWLDLPYTGSLSFALPLAEPRQMAYAGRLSGRIPANLLGEGYRADIEAKGNLERVDIALARLEGPPGSASFQGSLLLKDLAPVGHLALDLSLLGGSLPVAAGIEMVSGGGNYSLRASSATVGGLGLSELALELRRLGGEYAATLAFLVPEGRGSSPGPARVSGEANFGFGAKPRVRAGIDIDDLDLSAASPLLQSLLSPVLSGFLAGFRVGGRLDFRSDFRTLTYSTAGFSIGLAKDPSFTALLSLSGNEKSLVLEEGRVRFGGNEALAKGSAEFAGSKGLGFAVQLSLGGQNYSLEGALAGGSLHGSGSYGLEFSSRLLEGETFLSAQAKDLPIPGLGRPAFASFAADGRYSNSHDWSLALARLELGLPEASGPGRYLSLSGILGPDSGSIPDLAYVDAVSTLRGKANLVMGPAQAGTHIALELAGPDGEAYRAEGDYHSGLLDLGLVASASPLARFWSGPVTGRLGGELRATGSLETLVLGFDLRLEKGKFQAEDLSLRAKGQWKDGLASIQDWSASWGGYALDGGRASLDSRDASLSLGGRLKAVLGASALTMAMELKGFQPDGPTEARDGQSTGLQGLAGLMGLPRQIQRYRIEGLARNIAYQGHVTPVWPFVLNILPTTFAFDGGRDEVIVEYRDDGHFALHARPPFPIQATLEGSLVEGQVDAVARGLNIDLPFALALLGSLPVEVSKGRLSGDLKVHGPLADPDMDGILALEGLFLTIPGWVDSPVGPITAPLSVSGKELFLLAPSVSAGDATLMIEASADLGGWLPKDLRGRAKTLTSSPLSASAKILGVSLVGQAFVDLGFQYSGGIVAIDGSVSIQKAKVIIDPLGFRSSGAASIPSTYFDVDISLAVGPGVKVYFPSSDLPVVMGYADPSSALRVGYDQEKGELSFKGAVFLRGGEVFYIQRDFFLKSAKILFNENEDKFDPLITFLAERRARNGDGSVLISLRAENSPLFNLQPRLSSSPAMTDGQIVALLGANLLGAQDGGDVSIVKAAIMGSEMIPQLNVAKAFEERVRDALGLDIFFVQTQVVQRWLYDISGASQGTESGSLASYLDDTSLYLGKYVGDNIFLHAAALLQKDPLVPSGPLRLDSEFGVELEAPFGTITWSVKPESPESLFIRDQSLSLTWKVQL